MSEGADMVRHSRPLTLPSPQRGEERSLFTPTLRHPRYGDLPSGARQTLPSVHNGR